MDAVQRLENIIQSKLWAKNNITMGRIQCAKLLKVRGELVVIISSDIAVKPLWSRVERLLLSNEELIVFYDGQYCEELKLDEYDEYREYLKEDEWNALFEEDTTVKLEEMNLISGKDGFYIEVHENIEAYEGKFNEAESARLNQHFGF